MKKLNQNLTFLFVILFSLFSITANNSSSAIEAPVDDIGTSASFETNSFVAPDSSSSAPAPSYDAPIPASDEPTSSYSETSTDIQPVAPSAPAQYALPPAPVPALFAPTQVVAPPASTTVAPTGPTISAPSAPLPPPPSSPTVAAPTIAAPSTVSPLSAPSAPIPAPPPGPTLAAPNIAAPSAPIPAPAAPSSETTTALPQNEAPATEQTISKTGTLSLPSDEAPVIPQGEEETTGSTATGILDIPEPVTIPEAPAIEESTTLSQPEEESSPKQTGPVLPKNASDTAQIAILNAGCNSHTCAGCSNEAITPRVGSPHQACCLQNPQNAGCP